MRFAHKSCNADLEWQQTVLHANITHGERSPYTPLCGQSPTAPYGFGQLPGCSPPMHVHRNEEEHFVVLQRRGEANQRRQNNEYGNWNEKGPDSQVLAFVTANTSEANRSRTLK